MSLERNFEPNHKYGYLATPRRVGKRCSAEEPHMRHGRQTVKIAEGIRFDTARRPFNGHSISPDMISILETKLSILTSIMCLDETLFFATMTCLATQASFILRKEWLEQSAAQTIASSMSICSRKPLGDHVVSWCLEEQRTQVIQCNQTDQSASDSMHLPACRQHCVHVVGLQKKLNDVKVGRQPFSPFTVRGPHADDSPDQAALPQRLEKDQASKMSERCAAKYSRLAVLAIWLTCLREPKYVLGRKSRTFAQHERSICLDVPTTVNKSTETCLTSFATRLSPEPSWFGSCVILSGSRPFSLSAGAHCKWTKSESLEPCCPDTSPASAPAEVRRKRML